MLVVPAVFVDIQSFLIGLACQLYQKSIAYSCEGLCVESQFHCVVVIIMPVHTALTYDSFTVSFKMGTFKFSNDFFFFKLVLAILGPLRFLMN